MPVRRLGSPRAVAASATTVAAAAAIVFLWVLFCSAGAACAAPAEQPAAPPPFQRADAAVIHSQVRDILADARYAPRQSLLQWILQRLSQWHGPDLHMPPLLGSTLGVIFFIWCVAALLAILIHITWTLVTVIRAGRQMPGRGARMGSSGLEAPLDYQDLLARMHALAGQGAFRDALGVMMVALLRRLDEAQLLKFHPSKTNGDYVRDYPPFRPGGGDFRRFVTAFDAMVYGGAACGPEAYGRMQALFEQVRSDVEKEPQG